MQSVMRTDEEVAVAVVEEEPMFSAARVIDSSLDALEILSQALAVSADDGNAAVADDAAFPSPLGPSVTFIDTAIPSLTIALASISNGDFAPRKGRERE